MGLEENRAIQIAVIADESEAKVQKLAAAISLLYPTMALDAAELKYELRQSIKGEVLECGLVNPIKIEGGGYHTVSEFTLENFPGCRHIIISRNVYVSQLYRGRGIASNLVELRIKAAALAGYSRMMATVREDNEVEMAILRGHEFERISTFRGEKDDRISLWSRLL